MGLLIKTKRIEVGPDIDGGWYLIARFGRWRLERFYSLEAELKVWRLFDTVAERQDRLDYLRHLRCTDPQEYGWRTLDAE